MSPRHRAAGRLRRYLFGDRPRTFRTATGAVWIVPGIVPGWRRRKPVTLPDGWISVGYTTDDGEPR